MEEREGEGDKVMAIVHPPSPPLPLGEGGGEGQERLSNGYVH